MGKRMSRGKKGKVKSGTWFTRDLLISRAYWALSGTAKGLLALFMLKRDMDKDHNVLNRRSITMTYKELENLYNINTQTITGIKMGFQCDKRGLSRGSVTRGIKDLLAKGFVEIVRQGGAYQRDKTIYGLTEDWRLWSIGSVIRNKPRGKMASYSSIKKSQPPQPAPYTPLQPELNIGV